MKNIAVIIPCLDEELTIGKVISDFRQKLPEAAIYVFDNNSGDNTAAVAENYGAIVVKAKRRGKGFVVQEMFAKVDADIYVMIDGDATYDIQDVDNMISLIVNDEADMVVGARLKKYTSNSFRPFHTFGNRLVALFINKLFNANLTDVMSGFRVMNKAFVKNINSTSKGFEVETEITLKALKYGYCIREMNVNYGARPAGSFSKLSTFKDGILVLKTIAIIFRDYRPLLFFHSFFFAFPDFHFIGLRSSQGVHRNAVYYSRTALHICCRFDDSFDNVIYCGHDIGFDQ